MNKILRVLMVFAMVNAHAADKCTELTQKIGTRKVALSIKALPKAPEGMQWVKVGVKNVTGYGSIDEFELMALPESSKAASKVTEAPATPKAVKNALPIGTKKVSLNAANLPKAPEGAWWVKIGTKEIRDYGSADEFELQSKEGPSEVLTPQKTAAAPSVGVVAKAPAKAVVAAPVKAAVAPVEAAAPVKAATSASVKATEPAKAVKGQLAVGAKQAALSTKNLPKAPEGTWWVKIGRKAIPGYGDVDEFELMALPESSKAASKATKAPAAPKAAKNALPIGTKKVSLNAAKLPKAPEGTWWVKIGTKEIPGYGPADEFELQAK